MDLLLVLVRHGITDWNEQGRLLGRAEIGLNERGRAQARAVAEALAGRRLEAVLASPQRRAQETAAPIAAAHGLAMRSEPDLAEVWVGHWQGKTYEDLRGDADAEAYATDGLHVCAAIEDARSVQRRMIALLDRLRAGEHGARVCLVSHGDPIRLLLTHCLGAELPVYRRLQVAPGSVSLVRAGAQRSEVLCVNLRPGASAPE